MEIHVCTFLNASIVSKIQENLQCKLGKLAAVLMYAFVVAVVAEEPEFTDVIENITVAAGRNVRFACSVKNLGTYKVSKHYTTSLFQTKFNRQVASKLQENILSLVNQLLTVQIDNVAMLTCIKGSQLLYCTFVVSCPQN